VDLGGGDGLRAERLLQERDVGVLVGGGPLQEGRLLGAQRDLVLGRLVVEGGLEVLEREGVVEDADVALAEFRRRTALAGGGHRTGRGEGGEQRARAHHGGAAKAGLLQEGG